MSQEKTMYFNEIYEDFRERWCMGMNQYPFDEGVVESQEDSILYVIYSKETKLTKIGISTQFYDRFNRLGSQSGLTLYPLIHIQFEIGYDPCASFVEKFLHQYFKNKKNRGEWFDLTLRDLCQIREFIWELEGCDVSDNFKYSLEALKTGEKIIKGEIDFATFKSPYYYFALKEIEKYLEENL